MKKTIAYIKSNFINLSIFIYLSYAFYCYCINYNCYALFVLYITTLILILIFKIVSSKKLIKLLLDIKKSFFSINSTITFKLIYLILLFPLFIILLTNLYVSPHILNETKSIKDFFFSELNIFYSILSIYFFYSLFIILLSALGAKICNKLKLNFSSILEKYLFSFGFGIIIFSFAISLITFAGILYNYTVWLVIILFVILSWENIKDTIKILYNTKISFSFFNKQNFFQNLIILSLLFFLSFNFIVAIKPGPTDVDSMHSYFNSPHIWVQNHKYILNKIIGSSNMGQNTEMIYAGIISIVGFKYLSHFSLLFFILTILSFYLLLLKIFQKKHALLAILTIYFIPWNFYFIYTNKVEMFLSFYSVLLLLSFANYLKNINSYRYLYFAGLFTGFGVGIKYNMILLVIPVFLIIFILILIKKQNNFKNNLKIFIGSILLSLLVFSPWAIKNMYYFKNIFYPIEIVKKINSDNQYDAQPLNTRDQEIKFLKYAFEPSNNKLISIIKMLWWQSTGQNITKTGFVNFGFIPLLIIPFYFIYWLNKKIKLIIIVISVYIIPWFFLNGYRQWHIFFGITMLYALLPFLLIKNKILNILYFHFILSIIPILTFNISNNKNYILGIQSSKAYFEQNVPQYILRDTIKNLNLKTEEKILLVGDYQVAYINNNENIFILDPFFKISPPLDSSDKIYTEFLKQKNIKYIMRSPYKDMYIYAWASNHNQKVEDYLKNYNKNTPSIYQDMQKQIDFLNNNATIINNEGYFTLYKINNTQ